MPEPTELDLQSTLPSTAADGKTEKVAVKRKRAPGSGRRPKNPDELYIPIGMRIHPKAFDWVKDEAKRRGIGYQSVINQLLLDQMNVSS